MATDPVCGMHVDETKAHITKDINGKKYFFCSTNCLVTFEKPEKERKELRLLVIIGTVLSTPTIYFSYIAPHSFLNHLISFFLATPIQFYVGLRFYRGMWDGLKARAANMDTLIAVGTSAAWLYSTLVTFVPGVGIEVYFELSAIIITATVLGKFFEEVAKGKASESLRKLMNLKPKTAIVLRNGKEAAIPISEVEVGDIMIVKPGQSIPTDGVITEGHSAIDESMLTGESMPVGKDAGDEVFGATINKSGLLKIRATKVGADTTLSQIIELVGKAQMSKVPIQRLADKVSSYFVPAVILIAIAAALTWVTFGLGTVFALTIFISVLIIACPCALGLATPTALLVSSGKAAESGILVRSGEYLETARNVTAIVFDKTGTLTRGKPAVTDVQAFEGKSEDVLKMAAIVERGSEHPIGEAIVEAANKIGFKPPDVKNYETIAGKGISASYQSKSILVGNREFMRDHKLSVAKLEKEIEKFEREGKTTVIVAYGNRVIGAIAVADTLKDFSKEAVAALQKMGKEVIMMTGDNEQTAKKIAGELGIKRVLARVLPQDKAVKVKELQEEGKKVAFVGDGINDAPALAQSDVGIAIGSGTDVAKETGGIILIKDDLRDVVTAIDLSHYTIRKIKQNLFWAFAYNTAGIPIAAGLLYPFFGFLLSPAVAAFAMAFSSVSVVTNSLMMKRYKPKLK